MSCCTVTIVPFFNVTTTSVPFTGSAPKVTVYYWDAVAMEYYTVNGVPGSQQKIISNNVVIDHGGPATGMIKIE